MNQKNTIFEKYCLWLLDLISILVVYNFSTYLRFGNFRDMVSKQSHYSICLCFMLFCTVYQLMLDWNRDFTTRGYIREFVAILKYNGIMLVAVECVMFFMKWADVTSRLLMGIFIALNVLMMYALHVIFKKILWAHYQSDLNGIKVLLIGQRESLEYQIRTLLDNLDMHYQLVGAVSFDADLEGTTIASIPVVANKDNLFDVVRQIAFDEVVLSLPDYTGEAVNNMMSDFDEMGIICHRILDEEIYSRNSTKIEEFGGQMVITYSRFRSSYKRLLVKRLMDIFGGLVGLAITLVLTPFVAVAIKIDSKGPVFFSQMRIGRNGRRFKIYKFRSMYIDAEERKKELMAQNEVEGLMFKMENDPRITKVGRLIRKTSIDELPQFWNVLIGDMSLVGTRPPTEDEFEKYNLHYRRRLSMTPGLTGMWQVSGRSDIDNFDDVVKLDLKYIDNWSLTLDIKILLQTILVVFTGKGSK